MSYYRTLSLLLCLITTPLIAEELVILHTNDFHGHIKATQRYAGAAKISAYVDDLKARHPAVIFLDAGDAISGTPVSGMFKGDPIFEVMNLMGYDFGLIGNHEFDHGYRKIARFREIAAHPLLSANALGPDGRLLGDAPYALLERDGIKIGIIGLLTETAPTLFTPIGNEGLTFLKPADLLRELIPELRPQVDVLILLSHIGHENELKLADEFPALDVIIGGHSHTLVEHPIRVGNTLVAQANHYGTHLGIIKLKLEGTPLSITETFGDLIAADELPEGKPEVENLVSLYESKVEALVDVTLTQVDYDYSADALQPLLENILATAAGTDLGYYNRTGIRDQLARGDVTARMVWNIEPFGNTLVKMTLSGADLLILLSQEPSLHHAANDIDPKRQYSLATNSFIASHASLTFGEDITTLDTGLMIRDILIEHLRDQGLPPPNR